jgi:hypothetical protein
VIAFWPLGAIEPVSGLDGSWRAALSMAAEAGLHWGSQVDFTFGPLGFLSQPALYDSGLGTWAYLAHLALRLVTGITVVWLSFRFERGWRATGLAVMGVLASTFISPMASLPLLAFVMGMGAAARLPESSIRPPLDLIVGAGLGMLAGLLVLVKLNDGVAAVAVGGLVCVAIARTPRRSTLVASTFTIAFAGSAIGLWIGSGQRIVDIPAFLSAGAEIISGYSRAMGVEEVGRDWEYVAAVVVIALALTAGLRATQALRPHARLALIGAFVVLEFLAFKHGFVRHGTVSGGFFALTLLATGWALPWAGHDRVRRAALLGALGIAALAATRFSPSARLDGASSFFDQVAALADRGSRLAVIDGTRRSFRRAYDLPVPMLERIGTASVDVLPYETAVAWAYPELRWKPLPVFQLYQAYTPALDRLNAAALQSEGATFILRHQGVVVDSRHPYYEAPETYLAIVCRYEQVIATDAWQLLQRVENRCGPPEALTSVAVRPGDLISVPQDARPGRIVVAHVEGLETGLAAWLRAALWKSPIWSIWVTDVGRARLVPDNAAGPLILASPEAIGYRAGFRPPARAMSFTVVTGPAVGTPDDPQPNIELTIRFESIPLIPG